MKTRQEIFSVIQANMRAILSGVDGQEIVEDKSMRDYGADSLEMVEVVSRSMKQLQIKVPRSKLVPVSNLGELVDAFEQEAAKMAPSEAR